MVRSTRLAAFVTLALVAVTLMAGLSRPAAQSNLPGEKFRAFAVNMSGVGRTGSGTVDIVIDRWSSDAEREQLIKVFLEKGPEKLLDALQDTKRVGYIRDPQSLGWDLRFARQVQGEDGGRRIIVVTDRPIGFAEARNRPRTMDYPFTLIELHLDKDGNGEGKASVATKITYDKKKGTVELENYGTQPVMLTKVSKIK
jgi:hypothetical protein